MSVAEKKRLTDIVIGTRQPKKFKVPSEKARGILILLDDYRVLDDESLSIDDAFQHLYEKTSKGASLLRGFRRRDKLTQAQLAKKLFTTQSVIAELESAKRSISKKMAQKIGKLFDVDYREFL